MISSPTLRAVLAIALVAFAAFCLQLAWTEGGPGTWVLIVLALGAVTFAVGLIVPGRRRIALRLVAGVVVIGYLVYFGAELAALLRGGSQPLRVGGPSAMMAGVGVLVWGVPLLVYTLSGRTPREHAIRAAIAADHDFVLRDRLALAALERAGADLELPTEVRFHLDLPGEAHARSVANVAEREGLGVEVYAPEDPSGPWTCCVSDTMRPTWENIRGLRARLTELASAMGGEVEGWEALARSDSSTTDS
jgi:hypothetical protein